MGGFPTTDWSRSLWRGVVGETKTRSSVASLPLIAPVLIPLNLWRQKCGNPSEGWVFSNKVGKPLDLKSLVHRVIVPTLKAKKIEWEDALCWPSRSRNDPHATKTIPEALLKGIKLLEAAANVNA